MLVIHCPSNQITTDCNKMINGQLCQEGKRTIHIFTIYRSPQTSKQGFVEEMCKLFYGILMDYEIVLLGDTIMGLLCKTGFKSSTC